MAEAAVQPMNESNEVNTNIVTDNGFKKKVGELVDNHIFSWVMTILTMYALFGDDIRLAYFEKDADDAFYFITLISFVMFSVEIIASSFSKDNYVFNFYFWLDFISTISLLADIGWLMDMILGDGTNEAVEGGSAALVAASQGRMVRILRLVRLIRLVKLYKHANKREEETVDKEEPSAIGKEMSDLTTRRLILLILTMLMVLPIFQPVPYANSIKTNEYQLYGLKQLHRYSQDWSVSVDVYKKSVEDYITYGETLMYVDVCTTGCTPRVEQETMYTWIRSMTFNDGAKTHPVSGWVSDHLKSSIESIQKTYRPVEYVKFKQTDCFGVNSGTCESISYFSIASDTAQQAINSMLKTTFIMILLVYGFYIQKKTSERLVIKPIERMVSMVRQLSENPLQKTKQIVASEENSGYETLLLEQTLSKIGGLLQIGFGQAGDEIIGKNMGGDGALDPMIPGKKIYAIFGFCDIRYFVAATEYLQQDVMVFVNTIANVVHSAVHLYSGSTNKNIGEAFLLVWKLPKETNDMSLSSPSRSSAKKEASLKDNDSFNPAATTSSTNDQSVGEVDRRISQLADNALVAFLKTIVDIKLALQDGALTKYANHEGLKKAGWKLSMGFGLHIGWAIEGAIGSVHKIDASYLSPHVNMASRLEAASKQYGVQLLISHYLYSLLSSEAQAMCRKIDRVTVKGSAVPMELYTCDIDPKCTQIGSVSGLVTPHDDPLNIDFSSDNTLKTLQDFVPAGFYDQFNDGVAAYLAGDWTTSKAKLEASLDIKINDKPAQTLLKVMGEHKFNAPNDWEGFRPLTSK